MNSHSYTARNISEAVTQRTSKKLVVLSGKNQRGVGASKTKKSSLVRSNAQRPLGQKVLVKTEFVYADPVKESCSIVGDWNEWVPVQMHMEEKNLWSVVSMLPSGYHEFYFMVDGKSRISSRHPTTGSGMMNWRNIYGPPQESHASQRTAFYLWAQKTLGDAGLVSLEKDLGGLPVSERFLENNKPNTVGKPRSVSIMKRISDTGVISLIAGGMSIYFVLAAFYILLTKG